jgi:hypothetical protein
MAECRRGGWRHMTAGTSQVVMSSPALDKSRIVLPGSHPSGSIAPNLVATVVSLMEFGNMRNSALPEYMRCIASVPHRAPIRAGAYSPILGIDGSAPNRTAIIVDAWGAFRPVCENPDGRWQLFSQDDGSVAELVFA